MSYLPNYRRQGDKSSVDDEGSIVQFDDWTSNNESSLSGWSSATESGAESSMTMSVSSLVDNLVHKYESSATGGVTSKQQPIVPKWKAKATAISTSSSVASITETDTANSSSGINDKKNPFFSLRQVAPPMTATRNWNAMAPGQQQQRPYKGGGRGGRNTDGVFEDGHDDDDEEEPVLFLSERSPPKDLWGGRVKTKRPPCGGTASPAIVATTNLVRGTSADKAVKKGEAKASNPEQEKSHSSTPTVQSSPWGNRVKAKPPPGVPPIKKTVLSTQQIVDTSEVSNKETNATPQQFQPSKKIPETNKIHTIPMASPSKDPTEMWASSLKRRNINSREEKVKSDDGGDSIVSVSSGDDNKNSSLQGSADTITTKLDSSDSSPRFAIEEEVPTNAMNMWGDKVKAKKPGDPSLISYRQRMSQAEKVKERIERAKIARGEPLLSETKKTVPASNVDDKMKDDVPNVVVDKTKEASNTTHAILGDQDDDDAAALFFGGGKTTMIDSSDEESNKANDSDDDDAAALFFNADAARKKADLASPVSTKVAPTSRYDNSDSDSDSDSDDDKPEEKVIYVSPEVDKQIRQEQESKSKCSDAQTPESPSKEEFPKILAVSDHSKASFPKILPVSDRTLDKLGSLSKIPPKVENASNAPPPDDSDSDSDSSGSSSSSHDNSLPKPKEKTTAISTSSPNKVQSPAKGVPIDDGTSSDSDDSSDDDDTAEKVGTGTTSPCSPMVGGNNAAHKMTMATVQSKAVDAVVVQPMDAVNNATPFVDDKGSSDSDSDDDSSSSGSSSSSDSSKSEQSSKNVPPVVEGSVLDGRSNIAPAISEYSSAPVEITNHDGRSDDDDDGSSSGSSSSGDSDTSSGSSSSSSSDSLKSKNVVSRKLNSTNDSIEHSPIKKRVNETNNDDTRDIGVERMAAPDETQSSTNEKIKLGNVEDDAVDDTLHATLLALGISSHIDVDEDYESKRPESTFSLGEDSYILDLMQQVEGREDMQREEMMEEALERFNALEVSGSERREEQYLQILDEVKKEKEIEFMESNRKQDELLKSALEMKSQPKKDEEQVVDLEVEEDDRVADVPIKLENDANEEQMVTVPDEEKDEIKKTMKSNKKGRTTKKDRKADEKGIEETKLKSGKKGNKKRKNKQTDKEGQGDTNGRQARILHGEGSTAEESGIEESDDGIKLDESNSFLDGQSTPIVGTDHFDDMDDEERAWCDKKAAEVSEKEAEIATREAAMTRRIMIAVAFLCCFSFILILLVVLDPLGRRDDGDNVEHQPDSSVVEQTITTSTHSLVITNGKSLTDPAASYGPSLVSTNDELAEKIYIDLIAGNNKSSLRVRRVQTSKLQVQSRIESWMDYGTLLRYLLVESLYTESRFVNAPNFLWCLRLFQSVLPIRSSTTMTCAYKLLFLLPHW
jgi:hypothetical protein